jgi:hypothetical protein
VFKTGHVVTSYTGLFNHPLILRGKRACLRSVEEQRVYNNEKEDRKKLGVCEEMVWKMRELAWLGSDKGGRRLGFQRVSAMTSLPDLAT